MPGLPDIRFRKFETSKVNVETGDTTDSRRPDAESLYSAVAQLERAGEITLPVDVLIHFTNGDEILETWDGKSRFKDFKYKSTRKILV